MWLCCFNVCKLACFSDPSISALQTSEMLLTLFYQLLVDSSLKIRSCHQQEVMMIPLQGQGSGRPASRFTAAEVRPGVDPETPVALWMDIGALQMDLEVPQSNCLRVWLWSNSDIVVLIIALIASDHIDFCNQVVMKDTVLRFQTLLPAVVMAKPNLTHLGTIPTAATSV